MKQSQDMKGYTNEIFHLKNIGCDMKQSLLVLFNKMKQNIQIPKSLNQAFIKSIPMKKTDPMSLDSERGIFLVNKMRKILMSLIYNSMINVIEDNLSQSNIGARKKRAPRDHLFVLNALINERIQRKKLEKLDIVFYNVCQAFNSLWPKTTYLDLFKMV